MSFPCPFCTIPLHISGFYFWMPALGAIVICTLLGYSSGLGLSKTLIFAIVFWLPVSVLLGFVLTSKFNPKIERAPLQALDLFPRK
jgi:hypothetical protein